MQLPHMHGSFFLHLGQVQLSKVSHFWPVLINRCAHIFCGKHWGEWELRLDLSEQYDPFIGTFKDVCKSCFQFQQR